MNGKKILVVDDELIGRQLLEAVLLPEGYELLMASSGEEAIKTCSEQFPNLIIMDIMMPGIDGYQAIIEIKSQNSLKRIPIIIITALDDRDSRIKGLEAGANDYITKPFDRIEILAKINNLILTEKLPTSDNSQVTESVYNSDNTNYINILANEILDLSDVKKRFSGKIEESVVNASIESAIGVWSFQKNNKEILCLFGPSNINDSCKFQNALVSTWLWKITSNISTDPTKLSKYIEAKMNSSKYFDLNLNPWWFGICISCESEILDVSGFNHSFYKITDGSGESKEDSKIILSVNQRLKINKKADFYLVSKSIESEIKSYELMDMLNKHKKLSASQNTEELHKELIVRTNSPSSFVIKVCY